jgi:hypothetical protein
MMDKETIAAMTSDERALYLNKQRHLAAVDARYTRATSEFRTTQLGSWLHVETRLERQQREGEEREARVVEHHRREKFKRDRELKEAREHELAVARTYAEAASNGNVDQSGIDWADVLNKISDALGALVNRVQALEARVTKTEGNNEAANRRLEIASIRADTSAEKLSSEWKSEVFTLKTDINFLRFRLDAISAKKNQPTESHVIVHQGS